MLLNKKENVFHTGRRLSAEERQVFPFRMEKFFFSQHAQCEWRILWAQKCVWAARR